MSEELKPLDTAEMAERIAKLEAFVAAFDVWDASAVDTTGKTWKRLETARIALEPEE